jgi:hypothetical protein
MIFLEIGCCACLDSKTFILAAGVGREWRKEESAWYFCADIPSPWQANGQEQGGMYPPFTLVTGNFPFRGLRSRIFPDFFVIFESETMGPRSNTGILILRAPLPLR